MTLSVTTLEENMIKYVIKNIILVVITVAVTIVAIWLPGDLLRREDEAELSVIKDVPAQYYSGPSEAIIKNASRQLTNEERLQLITGTWESTVERVGESACELTEFGIKTITINRVENLYVKGLYPTSLSGDFDSWYTWSAIPYRALDTTFQSYAAIFWDVRFTKFDGSEYHRFIVTESGDILYADMSIGLGVEADSEVRQNLNSFEPRMSNCLYLINYYGEVSNTYNNGYTKVTIHDDKVTAYRVASATNEEKEKLDTTYASRFVDGFDGIEPDQIFSLMQTSNGDNSSTLKYLVSSQKTDNGYTLVLLPE